MNILYREETQGRRQGRFANFLTLLQRPMGGEYTE